MAFTAALAADSRVNQKLINKYEQIPTPSQPTKSKGKLFPDTKTNIKKVNKER